MIPGGLRIFVAVEATDMRRSIDGLTALVAEKLKQDALVERAMYVFANSRRDRIKVLWRNHSGWCLLYKRLDGTHRVTLPPAPSSGGASVAIDARALAAILDGVKKRPTTREIVKEARARVVISSPTSPTTR
jgi:transposase